MAPPRAVVPAVSTASLPPHCLHSGQLLGGRAFICFHAFLARSSMRGTTSPSGSCARCLHSGPAPPPLSPQLGNSLLVYIDMFSSSIRPNQMWAVLPAVSTAYRPPPSCLHSGELIDGHTSECLHRVIDKTKYGQLCPLSPQQTCSLPVVSTTGSSLMVVHDGEKCIYTPPLPRPLCNTHAGVSSPAQPLGG